MFVYTMYSLDKWYGREGGFSDGHNIKHMCDTDSGVLWHELVCVCLCLCVCAPIAVYKSCVCVFWGRWYVLSVCVCGTCNILCLHAWQCAIFVYASKAANKWEYVQIVSINIRGNCVCVCVCVQDAEQAINNMNGQWLGNRPIRTNWATRKPLPVMPKESRLNLKDE